MQSSERVFSVAAWTQLPALDLGGWVDCLGLSGRDFLEFTVPGPCA